MCGARHDRQGAERRQSAQRWSRPRRRHLPAGSSAWFHRALITRLLASPRDRFAERLAALAALADHIRAHDALPTKHTAPRSRASSRPTVTGGLLLIQVAHAESRACVTRAMKASAAGVGPIRFQIRCSIRCAVFATGTTVTPGSLAA